MIRIWVVVLIRCFEALATDRVDAILVAFSSGQKRHFAHFGVEHCGSTRTFSSHSFCRESALYLDDHRVLRYSTFPASYVGWNGRELEKWPSGEAAKTRLTRARATGRRDFLSTGWRSTTVGSPGTRQRFSKGRISKETKYDRLVCV